MKKNLLILNIKKNNNNSYQNMSKQGPNVNVGQVYLEIMNTINTNKQKSRSEIKKKLCEIELNSSTGTKLSKKSANEIISEYDKYIIFK